MASIEEGFVIAAAKFKIRELNDHQKNAILKFIEDRVDVFVNLPTGFGKSVIFQTLPCIFDHKLGSSGSIVAVVSPLLNLIKDQVKQLNSLGIKAISISDIESEEDRLKVERGEYSLVYGTPEAWLMNERWRAMLQNKTYSAKLRAVAVDEAHVIRQWGTSTNKNLAPFRNAYSRLHEFRALASNCNIIALTATATDLTRKIIFDILRMRNPHIIFESPNKGNITYSVEYMPKDSELEMYFNWLVVDLKEKQLTCDRTIIYCQTIKQCSEVYATLRGLLGKDLICAGSGPVLQMLHSCTPASVKQKILQSFTEENGVVRILIATIAFGMGIDCKAVRQIIHFGPSKNVESYAQETGRAGRDGKQSRAFLLYNGLLLSHVEGDMRSYVESKACRRKTLLDHFGADYTPMTHLHLCCDLCASKCECMLPDCKKEIEYPKDNTTVTAYVPERSRQVSEQQSKQVHEMLIIYHKSLVSRLLSIVPRGNISSLTDVAFLLGFSDVQIHQVINNLTYLFTLDDICNLVEIWDSKHSVEILKVVSTVFGDVDALAFNSNQTELDDLLVNEWEAFLEDEELLNLAADNIFQESQIATGFHELSKLAEDSFYEQNETDSSLEVGIPNAVSNVLSRINNL